MIEYEEVTQHDPGVESHHEETFSQHSTSFSFSLQIRTGEGLSIRGDAHMQKTVVPQRASKPVISDVEQEYDDTLGSTPRSAVRIRSTQVPTSEQKAHTTGPIVAPVTTRRVSGGTRLLLWVVLVLCVAFLVNGLVVPAISEAFTQIRYGDARIATFDINGHSFITQEQDNKVRIVVVSAGNTHNQVLVTPIGGVANHALVTLTPNGAKIEVAVNGTSIAVLVPDGSGYQWGSN